MTGHHDAVAVPPRGFDHLPQVLDGHPHAPPAREAHLRVLDELEVGLDARVAEEPEVVVEELP